MYTILTSAKKNIGDFLIRDKSLKLLRYLKPDEEFLEFNSWEPLDGYINEINNTKGVIICGGPGYLPNVYPSIYPLTQRLDNIKVPIYILGAGWYGIGGDQVIINRYKFSTQSHKFLDKVYNDGKLSTRDQISQVILKKNGYKNTILTGCPVMYDIEYIGKGISVPKEIRQVVFTTPQEPMYYKQSIEVLKLVREMFPSIDLYCSFHRGIKEDQYTSQKEVKGLQTIRANAERLGYIIVDASYDLNRIAFYSTCDLHIGYRVHAHLHFISQRKISFLLNEDGRGTGFSKLLGFGGIDMYNINLLTRYLYSTRNNLYMRGIKKLIKIPKPAHEVTCFIKKYVENQMRENFKDFTNVYNVIDNHFKVIKQFVETI
jgi:hypothetical protein